MGRAYLVLFSHDSRYADAFSEYCGRHEKERITVKTFTNEESLENYMLKEHIDILLTEDVPDIAETDKKCGRIVILSESRYINNVEYPTIYKYQRMDIILKQLYELLADSIGKEDAKCSIGVEGPEIIGCFSPCYEQEREQYARALAEYIGEKGRTVFINMAMFTTYDDEGDEGLSELLYYVVNDEENVLSYRLPALSRNTGMYESIPGVKNYMDLYDMDEGLAAQLFDKLMYLSEYRYVIVDIGVLGDVAGIIIRHCSDIYMPVPYDMDERRVNHFMKDCTDTIGANVMENIKRITLPERWKNNPEERRGWIRKIYEQY